MFGCCCKRDWYNEYTKALDKVTFDVNRTFDVVNLLRRLRLHGFALTSLTDSNDRKLIAMNTEFKSLNVIIDEKKTVFWTRHEALCYRELF